MTGTSKAVIGVSVLLAVYLAYKSFMSPRALTGGTAQVPAHATTTVAGGIVSDVDTILGFFKAPVSAAGVGPAASSTGNAAVGAGPIGTSVAQVTNSGTTITYNNGTTIDADNNYVDATGAILGYVGADNNIYLNNGTLVGSLDAGSDGNPSSTPEAQIIYANSQYIDDNGYYHDANGAVLGYLGTDGYLYDNNTNIQGWGIPDATNMPNLAGPPADQGNGLDQYGQTFALAK